MKTYLTGTLGGLILKIENISESCLDLDLDKLANWAKDKRLQIVNKSYNQEKSKTMLGIDNENLTTRISKSKLSFKKNDSSKSMISTSPEANTDTGITLMVKEGTIVESKGKKKDKSKSQNEFYLEYVDDVNSLKYEDSPDYNNDYKIEITQEELNTRLQDEKDENMKDFYMRQLQRINRDPDIFTNKKFLLYLTELAEPVEVLKKYKENYGLFKELIDNIIKSLIDNISSIPYTLRCICKIISILICKKFKELNNYERNAFIGEFIFGKCILPILINSDINAVITSTILSASTKRCLKIIGKVLTKINRGIFFEGNIDAAYTIFNHYLIEVIPAINKFYEQLIDVPLPRVLDELIKTKNPEDLKTAKYNYFKENPEELVNVQCICFSVQDILVMVKYLKPKLNQFKSIPGSNLFVKSVEKIIGQEAHLNHVVKNTAAMRNFFLVFKIESNPDKEQILAPKIFRFTFTNEIENSEIILKRIKFCVKLILRGLNLINHKVYSNLSQANSTKNFFSALNTILQMEEFNETEFSDKLPLNWYSIYMISNLQFMSEEYKTKDFDKFYDTLLSEEKQEIGFLNNKSNLVITKYGMNMRCVENMIEKVKRDLLKVKQIEKLMKMEKFIKNSNISVCIRLAGKEEETNSSKKQEGSFLDNIFFWNKLDKRKTVTNNQGSSESEGNPEYCTINVKPTEKWCP